MLNYFCVVFQNSILKGEHLNKLKLLNEINNVVSKWKKRFSISFPNTIQM